MKAELFFLWGVDDSGSCRPWNARCVTTGTPNTGMFRVPPGRTRPPEGGPGAPPSATPPQNPGRRRAGLAEGRRPSARTSVPATPRPGTPSSNPEGLSGVVRQARTYCGWHTTGQESLPPSRRTRVTIGLPIRVLATGSPKGSRWHRCQKTIGRHKLNHVFARFAGHSHCAGPPP